MKLWRIAVLATGILVALMAYASAAMASTATSPTGTTYTGEVEAVSIGHSVTHNPIAAVECESTFRFKIEKHGEGVTVGGNVSHVVTAPCTNSWHVTVVTKGSVEIHGTGTYLGILTWSGLTVEKTRFGITCRYATSNTKIGTITGGSPATLDVEGALPFHSGSGLCGSSATTMTGLYQVVTPTSFYVDP